MQIVIEVADTKADFVIELLNSLPFVAVQQPPTPSAMKIDESSRPSTSKTTRLLGIFPQLNHADETSIRQQAILIKHA